MAVAREQRSLFGEILDGMLAPLLLLWPMSVLLTWLVAQNISNQPFDRELADMVRALSKQIVPPSGADRAGPAIFMLPMAASEILRTDGADEAFYQVLGMRGELLSGEAGLPAPPPGRAPTGEPRFRDDAIGSVDVRVAWAWIDVPGAPTGDRPLVQVAETLGKRSRLATEIIKGVILPQFVILPLVVLLVWLALARGIAPLNLLQQRIRQRASTDLSPIDEREAPEEVSPLVRAINDLLGRLDQSIGLQKHFLADAAHQLKTPLAGLRMQAELAQRELGAAPGDAAPVRRSLQQIALASQRAAHMVNQLLAMARAENREQTAGWQPVDLAQLAVETVHDFVPRALERGIDLGYEGPAGDAMEAHGVIDRGDAVLLRELVRNLLDNALLYTPAGGAATVRVIGDPFGQVVVLQVEDSGPGIAAAERERVFQPFYRVLGTQVDGSGLGLAIVREIARQHGADLSLTDADARPPTAQQAAAGPVVGPGTLFTLGLPRAMPTSLTPPAAAPRPPGEGAAPR